MKNNIFLSYFVEFLYITHRALLYFVRLLSHRLFLFFGSIFYYVHRNICIPICSMQLTSLPLTNITLKEEERNRGKKQPALTECTNEEKKKTSKCTLLLLDRKYIVCCMNFCCFGSICRFNIVINSMINVNIIDVDIMIIITIIMFTWSMVDVLNRVQYGGF